MISNQDLIQYLKMQILTLDNGTVLSGWTVDKEGYINLETLVADLGNAKEDVKVTLKALMTYEKESETLQIEVTVKGIGEVTAFSINHH